MKNYKPDFYSIKGGGEFYDMSPHGLLVQRNFEFDMVLVEVLKVKFAHLGENKAQTWFKWNRANGRYSEFSYQSENPELCSNLKIDDSNWIIQKENNIDQSNINYYESSYLEPNYNLNDEDVPF